MLLERCRVVIAGAGLVGNSVAYHLTRNGWADVIVCDQGGLGTAADFRSGVMGLFKPLAMRNVIADSIRLYDELQIMGYDVGVKSKDRMIQLQRRMAYNTPTGLRCELLGLEDIARLHPHVRVDDLEGGVWVADDAVADPKLVCAALADLATEGGVAYIKDCTVDRVCTDGARVTGVDTDFGHISCDVFVNCTGMWARELGLACKPQVRIPSYPAEHYCVTTTLQVDPDTPCLKDYDGNTYAREWHGKLLVGWFEKDAKPAFAGAKIPKDWKKHLQEDDFKHLLPLWEKACQRIPELQDSTYSNITNTVVNFTPDGRWILGEAPEVKNYFVACGMNGNPLQGSGGIGKMMADWITKGKPVIDLMPFNVARFLDLHNNRQYLYQRTKEIVGRQYSILYPHQCEYRYARKVRCSPLYSTLEKRGAVFGIKMGYERALYFDTSKDAPIPRVMPPGSFFKPKFFNFMWKEHYACTETVGIIDMSSYSKIEINSIDREAVDYLQYLCSNNVDIPPGGIVHTGMHNEMGGYENDCMLARLSENSFIMVSPTSQQTRIFDWMTKHLPGDNSITIKDVTSMYSLINVVGPKANELINELSGTSVHFMPNNYRKLDIGYVSDVIVMGFTHTGEPGYCLYVPSEYALHVYDQLMTVGKEHGARDVGVLTARFMRIERFIPFWGGELTSVVTPYEAGNGSRVNLEKDFIGKESLLKQQENGITKRLTMFHLDNFDVDCEIWAWGGEPIYRNGIFVGTVTSAGYGFSVNAPVCLGYIKACGVTESECQTIDNSYIEDERARYEIDIAGTRFPIQPHLQSPLYTMKKKSAKTAQTI